MAYEVIARKWRPQQFDQVVGQEHVTRTLRNAITSKRLAHAYLFVGPRGIGKTSIARIFAKALNCEKGPTEKPCDNCDSCREIIAGTGLDVLEIDGASNNSVDQIRNLRDTVVYAPTRGRFKVYIIDEVHMLSASAFNALLKTLEEPPPHVKFLFATTEPDKVLATIVSRCQRFDLRRIPVNLLVERLRLIAEEEKVKIDNDALLAVARGAEGGLRDAESALDQLISFKGNEITEEDVLAVFGLVSRAQLEDLAQNVLKGDIKAIIRKVSELDEGGKDLQRLLAELMEHFRNLLVCLNVDNIAEAADLTDAQLESLKRQTGLTNTPRLLRVMDILTETADRIRFAISRRTLIETALIRCARAAVVVSLEEILAEINKLKSSSGALPAGPEELPSSHHAVAASRVYHVAERDEKTGAGTAGDLQAPPPSAPEAAQHAPGETDFKQDLALLRNRWMEVVDKAGKLCLTVRGALSDTHPMKVTRDKVIIGVETDFADEKEKFNDTRSRAAVDHTLSAMLKRPVTAEFIVADDLMAGKPEDSESTGNMPAVNGTENGQAGGHDKKGKGRTKHEIVNDKSVQKALEMFNGSIVEIRE